MEKVETAAKIEKGIENRIDYRVHLSPVDMATDGLKSYIPKNLEISQKSDLERVSQFQSNQGPSFLEKLDDETIAGMAIEQLLFLALIAISLDLQENYRVSQQTLKFIRALEEKRMKEAENSYTSVYTYMKTAGNLGGAVAGPLLIANGIDATAAQNYSRALPAFGDLAGNLDQRGVSVAGMAKQLASQMKQEHLEELQRVLRGEEKISQMIEQIMQLKLQSFQR